MKARFPYDLSRHPSIPVLPVRVGAGQGRGSSAVPAIVDTGADITVIPERLARNLRLAATGEVRIRGATGDSVRVPLYAATLSVAGSDITLPVVGLGREAILGRDIINRWTVVLRGPAGVLDVEAPVSSAS
ncbi:MAG: retroviral-like aspartic protease family protein [Armatimonadota bacterium]|nr:retroviral-like aspartic protease family protein [Armatimonadota bacterium]MDR7450273.1 retroviral-like aspartic protease family protein [Armatimonadota bacterium]MDR7467144.1 retroviral-like aspartic protease family protein [Armatimonadota bacterium]MDR7493314.1 retroviral-like aspartic protease family protein [Armatimonadota bacterium]MDR7499322.1 retroviral-like aspartic protease family protein [Armatimonadota bacterium]